MEHYSGKFITFEGIDGCGKGTQVEKLKEYFKDRDDVVFTREPGGEVVAENIRQMILDNKNTQLTALGEFLLFSAARAQVTKNILLPLLRSGKIVFCERYFDSSIAFQGFGRNIPIEDILSINKIASFGLSPDLTIYLQILPKDAFKRVESRGDKDRIESAGVGLQERVYEGYEFAKTLYKNRYAVVDAGKTREEVFNQIINVLKEKNIIS